ncbi:MAG TPA: 30S ribosome-binding factor RbfA [bacterium]|nr:30S ribosome-binding factor RbfA [bacterium]
MAGRKLEHLNETIRQKLGQLLVKEASDPRFHTVTITNVTVAKDLSTARVQFSAYDSAVDSAELTRLLNNAAGFFGHALARTLETRRTPRLHFYYDPGFDYAQEMDILLKKVRQDDE